MQTRHWYSTYKLSVESSEQLVEQLLDIINMSQNSSTLRIKDSIQQLEEVRDMDGLREQSQEHSLTRKTTVRN